jgi:hypothetical protein
MRYPASEKLEIIAWSSSPICRHAVSCASSVWRQRLSIAGMRTIRRAARRPWPTGPRGRIGYGTAFCWENIICPVTSNGGQHAKADRRLITTSPIYPHSSL